MESDPIFPVILTIQFSSALFRLWFCCSDTKLWLPSKENQGGRKGPICGICLHIREGVCLLWDSFIPVAAWGRAQNFHGMCEEQ